MSRKQPGKLEQVTQTWLAMPRSPGAEQEAAEEFYRKEVFPLVRQGFVPRERRKIEGECDGLILPVGTSPEPLILSIATLKPKQVLFLHTPETLRYVDEVVAATRLKPTEFERVEIDGSNALEIYEAIKAAFQKWGPEARLYVDFTGGKKAMVAGAAMAGAVIGANLIYIDNTRYLGDLRRPYPGTEYLSLVPNPYAVFGDLEEERAVNLFGQHDYATAAAIFQDLATRVPDAQLMVRYHLFGLLSRGYEAWDNFRLDEAETALRTLIRELERYAPLEKDLPLLDRLEPLRQQAAAVAILNRDLNPQAKFLPLGFLQDLSRITPLLFTFYHSALRREEQNKLDMAVLLWYRLLEIIGQRRLATYGLDTGRPDYEGAGFKPGALLAAFQQRHAQLFGQHRKYRPFHHLPEELSLVNGYLLLDALQDPLSRGVNLNEMNHRVQERNKSIFAHGFRFIDPEDYGKFRRFTEQRFERLCEIEGIDRADVDAGLRFVRLEAS